MKRFRTSVLSVLLYLWQLPQNLLGLLLFHIGPYNPIREIEYRGCRVLICGKFPGGISLGRYILVNFYRNAQDAAESHIVKHEYGHCRQSMILGPLYLPVIVASSGLHNLVHRYKAKYGLSRRSYYAFWTERWADRLGGVKRKIKWT